MTEPDIKATMEFPATSNVRGQDEFTWNEVKAMLDKEYMRRAEYVARIILALRDKYGEEVDKTIMQVIYQIGYEKGQTRAALVERHGQARDLETLANLIAHKTARLYLGTTAEVSGDKLVVRETYCPLPVKWRAMGLADDELVRLCAIFEEVDRGMVEGYNSSLTVELSGCRGLAEKGYCQMIVHKKGL